MELQNQRNAVLQKLQELGTVSNEEALALVSDDMEAFRKYLLYISAKCVKRLDQPKNKNLLSIVRMEGGKEQLPAFNQFLRNEEHLQRFLKIFPVVVTTCLSAHKLGSPKSVFDMVIMDGAG